MSTERIDIVVSEQGAPEVKRSIEEIGGAADKAAKPTDQLRSLIDRFSSIADQLSAALGKTAQATDQLTRAMANSSGIERTVQGMTDLNNQAARTEPLQDAAKALQELNQQAEQSSNLNQASDALGDLNKAAEGTGEGLNGASKGAEGLGGAAGKAAQPTKQLENQLAALVGKLGPTEQATVKAAQAAQTLERAVAAGIITEQEAVTIAERYGQVLAEQANKVEEAAGSLSTLERAFVGAARGIGQALGVFVSGEAFRKIAEVADQFDRYRRTLLATGQSEDDVARAQQELFAISQRTASGLKETEGNYVALTTSLREFGTSQSDIGKATETIQQGFRLSGKTAQEASGFIRELADSLKEDKVGTSIIDKLNTEAPALARVIEQQTGKTISDLRKMADEEELTTAKFIEILANARNRIAADGSLLPPSFTEQVTKAGNEITSFFASIDTRSGVFAAVGAGLVLIAENLGNIGGAALVAAAGFIAFKVASGGGFGNILSGLQGLVTGLYQVVAAQLAVIATNPYALLAALIAAAIAAVYLFGDSIKVSADGVVSLSDYFRAAFQVIQEVIGPVVNFLRDGFVTAYNGITDAFSKLGSFFGVTLDDIGSAVKFAVGTYLGVWTGLYNAIVAAFSNLPAAFEAIFKSALNGAIALVEDGVNKIITLLNGMLSKVGVATIDAVKVGRLELSQDAADVGGRIRQGFTDGMQQGRDALQSAIDGVKTSASEIATRARTIAEERKKIEAANGGGLSTARKKSTYSAPDDSSGGGGNSGAAKLERELSSLMKTLDPLTAAQEKLRAGTETLNKAFEAGLVTAERRDFLLGRLKRQLEDQLDPVGALNKKLEEEERLIGLSNSEREIQNRLLQIEKDLRKAGVDLGPEELAAYEKRLRMMQQTKDQTATLQEAMTRTFKAAEDAFVEFVKNGKVDFKSLVDSLLSDLTRLAFKALVVKPLMDSLFSGGSSGGGGLMSGVTSFFRGLFGSTAAEGNNWTVGGVGGIDSQFVAFRATPGETVNVSAPGRGGPPGSGVEQTVVVNVINNTDASAKTQERRQPDGSRVIDVLIEKVGGALATDIARGGSMMNKAIEGRYAINPVRGNQR